MITDANVPVNLGAGTLEDPEILADTQKHYIWEDGDGMPQQLRFDQTLGNQLTIDLVIYDYAAYTAGRYPGATAVVGGQDVTAGNGHQPPAF